MDWSVYWFMFPVCVVVASLAMFSGISGAAMLVPVFLIGFPLVDVPLLTTVEAIGTSLFLETSGFGSGVYGYFRRRLVDWRLAGALIAFSLPAGPIGAVLARQVPAQSLRIGYGVAMLGLAWILLKHQQMEQHEDPCEGHHGGEERRDHLGGRAEVSLLPSRDGLVEGARGRRRARRGIDIDRHR